MDNIVVVKDLVANVTTEDLKKELKRREDVEIRKKVKEYEKELRKKLK